MAYKQKVTTFDDDTGQVIDEKVRDMYSPFNPYRGYNYKYKSRAIKSYLDTPLPDKFSDAEIGKIFRLTRLIYGDSNLLAVRSHSYVKPLSKTDIINEFKLKDRQGRALLKKLLDNKVLKDYPQKQGEVHYYFNPVYFFSGVYLNLNLYLIFQDELREHLPEYVILKFLEQAEKQNLDVKSKRNEGA